MSSSAHTDAQLALDAILWPDCYFNPHCGRIVRDVCNLVRRQLTNPMLVSIGGECNTQGTDCVLSLDLGVAPEWRVRNRLSAPLRLLAAVSLSGQVMAVGGWDLVGPTTQVQLWSPRSNVWQDGPHLQQRRIYHTATVITGGVVVVYGGGGATDSVEVLRAGASQWTKCGNMPLSVYGHAATCPRTDPTKVVVMAGHQYHYPSTATYCYDAASDRRDFFLPAMSVGRSYLRAVALGDGCSYAVGGRDRQFIVHSLVERLDLRTPEWRVVSPMQEARSSHATAVLDEWSFVVLGGVGNDGHASANTFVYDSRADRWSDRPEWTLPSPVSGHAVVNVHM